MLERPQEFAVALEEQGAVRSSEIHCKFRAVANFRRNWRIGTNAVLQTKSAKLECATKNLVDASGSGNSILNRHSWGRVTSRSYGKTFLTPFEPKRHPRLQKQNLAPHADCPRMSTAVHYVHRVHTSLRCSSK